MPRYEYKVVPAPTKGEKAKGVKTAEGRFALTIEGALNEMGASGWEYLRAELLPSEERSGLTGTTTNWRNVLVFRRALDEAEDVVTPRVLDAPGSDAPAVVAAPSVVSEASDAVPVGAADARREFDTEDRESDHHPDEDHAAEDAPADDARPRRG